MANIMRQNGIKIIERREDVLTQKQAEVHYDEHKEKEFFPTLVNYMTTGDVKGIYSFDPTSIIMVVASTDPDENENNFIERSRKVVKEVLRPLLALKREDFPDLTNEEFKELSMTANGVHASDSAKSALREINNLFPGFFNVIVDTSERE